MADNLGIKRSWFHKNHYDIPKKRIKEIISKSIMVSTREIINIKNNQMELRMYFFVPYNISPIQQAIQAGHAAQQYDFKYRDNFQTIDFIVNHKTWIILNGGTTNDNPDTPGTMQEIFNDILAFNEHNGRDVNVTTFHEPDLNDAMTAICFVCEEPVFNYDDYPDLAEYILSIDFPDGTKAKQDSYRIKRDSTYEELKELFHTSYEMWEKDVMGGSKNVFLRNLLKGKKLA